MFVRGILKKTRRTRSVWSRAMYSGGIAIVIAIVGTYLSASSITMTSWDQTSFRFSSRGEGCYLVTNEVLKNVPEIKEYKIGMLNLFLQHTSAGLSLNENCDPDVREDMETSLQRVVPEGNHYIHDAEGPDDMPGHVKSSLVGVSLDIPIRDGRLATGTWQGIYLCEFRRMKHSRSVVATIQGQKK